MATLVMVVARMDDEHLSVMSCQHSRPMGRYAGCKVISDLLGEPMLRWIPWYVTVVDLGPAGALYTKRIYPAAAVARQLQVRPALGR